MAVSDPCDTVEFHLTEPHAVWENQKATNACWTRTVNNWSGFCDEDSPQPISSQSGDSLMPAVGINSAEVIRTLLTDLRWLVVT